MVAATEVGEEPVDLTAACKRDQLDVRSVFLQQAADTGSHHLSVAEDVADEAPGDPVVDTVGVLAAAVAPPALDDAPQARHGG